MWLATLTGPLNSMELVPGPETSPASRKRWPQNWTSISSMVINDRKKTLHDWPPSQVPWIRWNWPQVLKPRLLRENVDHINAHKFPAWKLTIERKSHVIGHPYRSPGFDGIGPRSWNLACFEKTLTTEGRKFPARKLMIERKSHVIGHPHMSPGFDGIGPRSWNLACFKKTLTTELDINFQHEN